MKIGFKLRSLSLFGILMGVMMGSFTANAGTASSVFNFEATFVGGGCEISAPANVVFNGGDILTFADIMAATEAGTPKTLAEFNVVLKNCAGWGLMPAIKVSGAKTTAFGSTLFTDTNGSNAKDAYGFGVYLKTSGNAFFNSNINLGFNGNITAKNWSSTTGLDTLTDSILPMHAVILCGNCSDNIERRGGDFKATVTFDFVYE